jgi:hypothetical protein
VDDITLHLSTPTDCQIDRNVEPLLRALHKKHSISGARALFDFTRDDAVRALERRGLHVMMVWKVHVTCM